VSATTSATLSFIDPAKSAPVDPAESPRMHPGPTESPPADPGPAESSTKPLHLAAGAALTETS
jgi:hypothetical protein